MSDVPLSLLFSVLVLLILLSAFFSGSETSMMALNRYRLKHLARHKHRGAQRASALLERPDRLIGLILLGNNFVNILASALATVIALRLMGEAGIAVAAGLLTFVILIFAEVAPKTLAALHPERLAFPASYILGPLLKVLYPLVWVINWIANGLLRPFKVSTNRSSEELTGDELRTVVKEAGPLISRRHQNMLVSILDLEKVTVDDIMVPRNEINGVDLEDEENDILELLTSSQHTRLPLYRGDINDVVGILHLRTILAALRDEHFDMEALTEHARAPYFVPAGTPLHTQLFGFQRRKERVALIVDEYGEVEGLTTLEDILEEIVGEFTTDPAAHSPDIHALEDGSYLVDGSATIRDLNRAMNWDLPTDGPKTLNGLILEHMEAIPETGTSLLLAGYPVEITQTTRHSVKMAKVDPALRRQLVKPTTETD